jgi:hypothetical protein
VRPQRIRPRPFLGAFRACVRRFFQGQRRTHGRRRAQRAHRCRSRSGGWACFRRRRGSQDRCWCWACAPRRGLSRHGRRGLRLLLRQALLEGDEVDVGQGGVPRSWWLRLPHPAAPAACVAHHLVELMRAAHGDQLAEAAEFTRADVCRDHGMRRDSQIPPKPSTSATTPGRMSNVTA